MPTMHSSSPPAAAPAASSKEAAATVAATATATPTHHEVDAPAAVHESTLQQLTHDPLRHAAHPEGPCLSLDCLRAHCQWLASVDPAAAGQPSTDSSPSTSPFSGSPRSTRSGTSPGYANDWALRPEPLAVRSDKPSRTRRDRAVHQLASAKLAESNAVAVAAASTTGVTAAICATTDEAFAAAASSSSSSFTSCSLATTAASSSSVVSSQSAFSSQLNVGVVPPAASPSELGPSSSSSAAAAPAAPIPAGDPILQPTVGGLSKLLQRRQQRKQQDGHAT